MSDEKKLQQLNLLWLHIQQKNSPKSFARLNPNKISGLHKIHSRYKEILLLNRH